MVNNLLALDVGDKRIGVALMRTDIKMAMPYGVLENEAKVIDKIKALIEEHSVNQVVVGHPRDLNGNTTEQTLITENFADQLKHHLDIPVTLQDEAVTSIRAEGILKKSNKPYQKGDIDALSASLILEDFAQAQGLVV